MQREDSGDGEDTEHKCPQSCACTCGEDSSVGVALECTREEQVDCGAVLVGGVLVL